MHRSLSFAARLLQWPRLIGLAMVILAIIILVGAIGIGQFLGNTEMGLLQQRTAVLAAMILALGVIALLVQRITSVLAFVLTVPVFLYCVGSMYVLPFTVDDAYISMRYARNLVEGYGLVFNTDGPPVEGYTNLLLVLVEAGLMKLGSYDLWPVKLLLVACGLATLVVIAWYGYQRLNSTGSNEIVRNVLIGCSLVITATSSPFILWSVGGLETVLFSLLVCLAAILYGVYLARLYSSPYTWFRNGLCTWLIDGVLFLSIITRPEGLLFWILTAAHTLLLWLLRGQRPTCPRQIGMASGLTMILIYAVWKNLYFGRLVPLTYLAKESSLSLQTFYWGGRRLFELLSINGNFAVAGLLLAGLVWALWRREQLDSPLWYFGGILLCYGAYVVSRGYSVAMDDAYRLYVPAIPLTSLLLIEMGRLAVVQSSAWQSEFGQAMVVSALTALVIIIPSRMFDLRFAKTNDLNWGALGYRISAGDVANGLQNSHIRLGKWLKANAAPDATIVLWDAGAIPYFSGLRTIDTWSLNDPTIVTLKRKLLLSVSQQEKSLIQAQLRSYVLEQKPDYIVQDGLKLLDIPSVSAEYEPIGMEYTLYSAYYCNGQMCSYKLNPQRRIDR